MGKKKQEKQEKEKQKKQKDKLKKLEKQEKQQKKQKKPDRDQKEKSPKKKTDRDHSDRIGSTYLRPEFHRRDAEDIDVQVKLKPYEKDVPESARAEAHAEHMPESARTEVHAGQMSGTARTEARAENAKRQARAEKRRTVSAEKPVTAAPGGDAPRQVSAAAEIFRALGDENRLRILALLRDGELCAGDLLKALSIVQSTLSHHMKILVESGIVKCRRQGKWSYYSVDQGTLEKVDGLMRQLAPEEQTAKNR